MDIGQMLAEMGYEDVVVFESFDYSTAFIGVSHDNRAVYDYNKMAEHLIKHEHFNDTLEAMEWIDYNTLRALPYMGDSAPIVVFGIESYEEVDTHRQD